LSGNESILCMTVIAIAAGIVAQNAVAGKKIEELSLPNGVISVLIIRGKSRTPTLSRSNMPIEKGDNITILDLSDGLKGLEGVGFRDYTQINL